MDHEEVERLESHIADLEAKHEAAETEARNLEARVKLADGLLARVGHVPGAWRLQLGLGAVFVAFVWGWFFGFSGSLEWFMAGTSVLMAAFAGVGVDAQEKAWKRIEGARLEVPSVRVEENGAAAPSPEPAEAVEDAVPKRTRRA